MCNLYNVKISKVDMDFGRIIGVNLRLLFFSKKLRGTCSMCCCTTVQFIILGLSSNIC